MLFTSSDGCLLQFRVLGFGLLQDGDVRVGVFPQREEVLRRRACRHLLALPRLNPFGIVEHRLELEIHQRTVVFSKYFLRPFEVRQRAEGNTETTRQ